MSSIIGAVAAARSLALRQGLALPSGSYWPNVIHQAEFETSVTENLADSGYGLVDSNVELTPDGDGYDGVGKALRTTGSDAGTESIRGDTDSEWNVDAQDWTWEAFLYKDARPTDFPTVAGQFSSTSSLKGWIIFLHPDGVLRLQLWTGPSTSHTISDPDVFPLSTWFHCCGERSGDVYRLYIDGEMKVKGTGLGSSALQGGGVYGVGSCYSEPSWLLWGAGNGNRRIDGVRFTRGVARYDSDAGFSVPSLPYPTE